MANPFDDIIQKNPFDDIVQSNPFFDDIARGEITSYHPSIKQRMSSWFQGQVSPESIKRRLSIGAALSPLQAITRYLEGISIKEPKEFVPAMENKFGRPLHDIGAAGYKYLKGALFFLPVKNMMKAEGWKEPEPVTPAGKAVSPAAETLGFLTSPAFKAIGGVLTKIPFLRGIFVPALGKGIVSKGVNLGKSIARGAATLGAAEFLKAPEEGFVNIPKRLENAKWGGKTGAFFGALGTLSTTNKALVPWVNSLRRGIMTSYMMKEPLAYLDYLDKKGATPEELDKALALFMTNLVFSQYFASKAEPLSEQARLGRVMKIKSMREGIKAKKDLSPFINSLKAKFSKDKDFNAVLSKAEEVINKLIRGEKIDPDNPLGVSLDFVPEEKKIKVVDLLPKEKKTKPIALKAKELPQKQLKTPQPKAIKEAKLPEKGVIPKELESLAKEARKYKTAEKFIQQIGSSKKYVGTKYDEKLLNAGFKGFEDFYNQAIKEIKPPQEPAVSKELEPLAKETPKIELSDIGRMNIENIKSSNLANVINEQGYLELYHGSSSKNIRLIRNTRKIKNFPWFAADKETARRFALQSGGKPEVVKVLVNPNEVLFNGNYFASQKDAIDLREITSSASKPLQKPAVFKEGPKVKQIIGRQMKPKAKESVVSKPKEVSREYISPKEVEPSSREKAVLVNKIANLANKSNVSSVIDFFEGLRKEYIKEKGKSERARPKRMTLLRRLRYIDLIKLHKAIKDIKKKESVPKEMSLVPVEVIDEKTAIKTPQYLSTKGKIYQGVIRLWGEYAGTGLKYLENVGFGDRWTKGLVKDFMRAEMDKMSFKNNIADLVDIWHRVLTGEKFKVVEGKYPLSYGRKALERGWEYLEKGMEYQRPSKDGKYLIYKAGDKYIALSKPQQAVLDQIKRSYDMLLEKINNVRVSRGQEKIKPRENYVTHIFHAMVDEFLGNGKLRFKDLPVELKLAMDFIPAKGDYDPYLFKRYGVKIGLKKDVLAAFTSYVNRAADVMYSEPIRKAKMIKKFLEHRAKQEPESPVDYVSLSKIIDRYAKEYANRPSQIERLIRGVLHDLSVGAGKTVGRLGAKPETQRAIAEIFNRHNILDKIGGLTYLLGMGYRPHSASKNFFQHLLILNFVKPKYLSKAIFGGNDVDSRAALRASLVYNSRKAAFVPETEMVERFGHKVKKSAFSMFRAADRKNVKDAFLSAYYQARAGGKPFLEAVREGDRAAANTQWLYLHSNRMGIARKFGRIGRLASIFSTWPIHWIENVTPLMFSKTQKNIEGVLRYAIGSAILTAIAASLGIKYFPSYTGWTSPVDFLRRVSGARGMPTPQLILKTFKLKPPVLQDLRRIFKHRDGVKQFMELFFRVEE